MSTVSSCRVSTVSIQSNEQDLPRVNYLNLHADQERGNVNLCVKVPPTHHPRLHPEASPLCPREEREFFVDILLVRIHCIIAMIRWTGLAPWGFESPFPGSFVSTFLGGRHSASLSRIRGSPGCQNNDSLHLTLNPLSHFTKAPSTPPCPARSPALLSYETGRITAASTCELQREKVLC